MSELAQVVQEADAMEAALVAPLFDGVRAAIDRALNGLNVVADAERARVQEVLKERDEARHAKAQMELRWQAAEKENAALAGKVRRHYERIVKLSDWARTRLPLNGLQKEFFDIVANGQTAQEAGILGLVRPDERCMCQTTCVECEKCR